MTKVVDETGNINNFLRSVVQRFTEGRLAMDQGGQQGTSHLVHAERVFKTGRIGTGKDLIREAGLTYIVETLEVWRVNDRECEIRNLDIAPKDCSG